MKTRIISFSLWGRNPRYCFGAVRNAELYPQFFPNWKIVFFHDNSVPKTILRTLIKNGAELKSCEGMNLNPYMWRFLANDLMHERFMCRDCDSRPSEREVKAVREWIDSELPGHVIRDHPHHASCAILSGMWGCKKGLIHDMEYLMTMYRQPETEKDFGMDQNFLRDVVWPTIRDKSMQHDWVSKIGKASQRFQLPSMVNRHFIGLRFNEFDEPEQCDLDTL
jgi:hypothetical protein